jgi:hypothetical protein
MREQPQSIDCERRKIARRRTAAGWCAEASEAIKHDLRVLTVSADNN